MGKHISCDFSFKTFLYNLHVLYIKFMNTIYIVTEDTLLYTSVQYYNNQIKYRSFRMFEYNLDSVSWILRYLFGIEIVDYMDFYIWTIKKALRWL